MKSSPENLLILDNVRSSYNVGSILRTAEGAGLQTVWLCGITPSPALAGDPRPPHSLKRVATQIAKTALGAEGSLDLHYESKLSHLITQLLDRGYTLLALEQSPDSISLFEYTPAAPWALIVGNEVEGVNTAVLRSMSTILEIPMYGGKESLNVAVATGIALYHLVG